MRIVFYCPDRHIVYNGATAERTGVGGGVTVRLRMAAALARLGHAVTLICNCERVHQYRGVNYLPLDQAKSIDGDILIVHSTAGTGVGGLFDLDVNARIRILLVAGHPPPPASDRIQADWVYPSSNFIALAIQAARSLPGTEILVSHHGVERPRRSLLKLFRPRDPFRLIYTSHPSKGLDTAIAVTRELRAHDRRFQLHCYGGDRLWGGAAGARQNEEGVHDHGLVGQDELLGHYARSGFAFHLQSREEPFGICLAEAMGAGCVVVASPVGAFPELVEPNRTGLMIGGDHETRASRDEAVKAIVQLVHQPSQMTAIGTRASAFPLDWDTVARTWTGHWNWLLSGRPSTTLIACTVCGNQRLPLADGFHCLACGRYSRV